MSQPDEHKVFNNSKAARQNALAVLKKAKELEAKQLKNGAKWKRQDKVLRLVKVENKNCGPTSTSKKNHTDTY